MCYQAPTIERGIPMPETSTGRTAIYAPLLTAMQVGGSFVVPRNRLNHIWRVAKTLSPRPKLATRKLNEKEVRVWRIESQG